MALHDELLEQAANLIKEDSGQAGLRRGISTAYYALFHLLIAEATSRLAQDHSPALQARMRRAFAHADMANVCHQFESGNFPPALKYLVALPLEPDLKALARSFRTLQEDRLLADYDLSIDANWVDATLSLGEATDAFHFWSRIKHTQNATIFLTALLLGRHWNR